MLSDPPAGLAFAFARTYPSVTPGGLAVAAGKERYWHHSRLLCGAAEVAEWTTDSGASNFHSTLSGGVASDSTTPMLVYFNGDQQKVVVYKGALTSPPLTIPSLFVNIPVTVGNVTHDGQAAVICHGLLVWICEVKSAANQPVATSVLTWQEGEALTVHFVDDVVQSGLPRSKFFQIQSYRVLETDAATGHVLKAWFAFSDYVINNGNAPPTISQGGRYFLMKATRASITTKWDLGAAKLIYKLPDGFAGTAGRHAHPPYVERYGAAGLRFVCPVGDAYGNNKVVCLYRTDENYTDDSGWTTQLEAHGSKAASGSVGEGNQFVASAPHGYPAVPTGQLIGGDEVHHGISRIAPTSNATDKIVVQKLYGPTAAGINRAASNAAYVFNTFRIECQNHVYGGPFVSLIAPGAQNTWFGRKEASRIVFSPDGNYWGQCFAVQHGEAYPAVFVGNSIMFGSLPGYSGKLRSIAIPTFTAQQPLVLSDGGTNRLEVTGPADGSVQAPNTAVLQTNVQVDALAGIRPPCAGPVYRVTSPNVSGAQRELGIWRITKDVAGDLIPANSKIKVRVWVYPLPWKGGSQPIAASTVLHVALGQYRNPAVPANPILSMERSREEFSYNYGESGDPVRGWFPMTMDTDTQATVGGVPRWNNDGGTASSTPTVAFPLGLRLTSRQNTSGQPANPCDFLIAFEHVSAGSTLQEYPGGPIPAGTTGNSEEATVSGFTCGNSWTIEMAGEVPDHCWDLTDVNRPNDKVLCTFVQSGSAWVSVIHTGVKMRLKFANGQTLDVGAPTLETFQVLRGSPVLFALSCVVAGGVARYGFSVSVGGSSVVTVYQSDMPAVKPTSIRFGNTANSKVEAMLWYGGRIHESEERTDKQQEASLRNLDMLFQKAVPLPPGQIM